MIEISKKTIKKFHNFIDDYSSFEKCWNFSDVSKIFLYKDCGKYKQASFKNFSYLIYCSCDSIHHRGKIAQMCDNPKCCNPFHLQLFLPSESKESKLFEDMLSRMRNPNNPFYDDYGGRGLELDSRWNPDLHLCGVARLNFYNDIHELGFREDLTIDRIDNNKGYLKNNIRFVDWKTQGQNRRTTRLTPEIIRYIRKKYNGSNAKDLGREFNISTTYVIDIVNEKYWKNIT